MAAPIGESPGPPLRGTGPRPAPLPAAPPAAGGRLSFARHLGLGSFNLGIYFVITPLYTILLQVQVTETVAAGGQGFAIGLATGVGGLFAMVLPPLVGHWSDGMRTRWGRRLPVMVGGSLGVAAALLLLYFAGSYPAVLVGFVLAVAFVNVAGASYVSLIPDSVQAGETGKASGAFGGMLQLGSVTALAATLAMSRAGHVRYTYPILVAALVLTLATTIWALGGERSSAPERRPAIGLAEFLSPLWTGDFGWAFLTRFLNVAALYTVLPFLLLAFRDLLMLAHPDQFTALFELLLTVAAVPFALLGGWLSDRWGRKRFVYASGAITSLVLAAFILFDLPAEIVLLLGVAYGVGYGCYSAVDWALALDTLPDRARSAKDLGLFHVADALPRVLLPTCAGIVLDLFNRTAANAGYRAIFLLSILLYVLSTVLVGRIRSVR